MAYQITLHAISYVMSIYAVGYCFYNYRNLVNPFSYLLTCDSTLVNPLPNINMRQYIDPKPSFLLVVKYLTSEED